MIYFKLIVHFVFMLLFLFDVHVCKMLNAKLHTFFDMKRKKI